jgi:hypothetical protein
MDVDIRSKLVPGTRVTVTQQIAGRNYTLPTATRGTVVKFEQRTTGSWFAHSKGDKLWLDRLVIQLPDGEITTLSLDDYSVVDIEEHQPQADVRTQE